MGSLFSSIVGYLNSVISRARNSGLSSLLPEKNNNVLEQTVMKLSDIKNGEMKEVSFGTGKVLLCRNKKGELSAVGSKCTHYGARLITGVYCGDSVRCPWHGACFNTKTGDVEDYPAGYALPLFEVRVSNDDIIVRANIDDVMSGKLMPSPCKEITSDRLFVIIGGGAAGASCAETLRKAKFAGRILVISEDRFLPYDRPKLSKVKQIKPENILLKPKEFWDTVRVEYLLETQVVELDVKSKSITLHTGEVIQYDTCLVATGGKPRKLPIPNVADAKNAFYLRSAQDSLIIQEQITGKNVVVIGSSFIGMEMASTAVESAASISVVSIDSIPFEHVLGPQVGEALKNLHVLKGVQFYLQRNIQSTTLNDAGYITEVSLDSGESLPCDTIILGTGVLPSTDFIRGLELDPADHSIVCDEYMKAHDGLYVAGDIAKFPLAMLDRELTRIEHWGMAETQGAIAAWNMAGIKKPMNSVPFFWTSMYGKSVRYSGHARQFDQVIFDMNSDGLDSPNLKFSAYYCHLDRVLAVATVGCDPVASITCDLMRINKMPNVHSLQHALKEDGSVVPLLKSLI